MLIDWFTVGAQTLNFIILVWLLIADELRDGFPPMKSQTRMFAAVPTAHQPCGARTAFQSPPREGSATATAAAITTTSSVASASWNPEETRRPNAFAASTVPDVCGDVLLLQPFILLFPCSWQRCTENIRIPLQCRFRTPRSGKAVCTTTVHRWPMWHPAPSTSASSVPDAEGIVARISPLLAPYHGRYSLIAVPADVPWGKASTGLVNLIYDREALGLIATDRNSSHLAEQLAAKSFVPLIAVSADHTLTSVNIPWVVRLPADTPVEDALTRLLTAAEKSGPNRGRLREILTSAK